MAMCALSVCRVGIAATSQRCHQWVGGHRGHQQMEEVWAWNKLTDHDSTTTEGQQQQTAELDKRHAADSRVDIHQDLGIDSTHTLDPQTFWICKNNLSDVRICYIVRFLFLLVPWDENNLERTQSIESKGSGNNLVPTSNILDWYQSHQSNPIINALFIILALTLPVGL